MAPFFGGGIGRAVENEYLFIDGNSLRCAIRDLLKTHFNQGEFRIGLVAISGEFEKIFFYDAIPIRENGEDEVTYLLRTKMQREEMEARAVTDRVHVNSGIAERRKKRGMEQKMVDVMLAVDMLRHASRGNVRRMALLTGDKDFVPLVEALVEDGIFLTLLYPPGHTSEELRQMADRSRPLQITDVIPMLDNVGYAQFSESHMNVISYATPALLDFDPDWTNDKASYKLFREDDLWTLRYNKGFEAGSMKHAILETLRFWAQERYRISVPDDVFQRVKSGAT